MALDSQNIFQSSGTKKRMVMHHELEGKFKSKSDFLKYFKEACKFGVFELTFICSATLRASNYHAQQRFSQISLQESKGAACPEGSQTSSCARI
jgi:hypothetical protein